MAENEDNAPAVEGGEATADAGAPVAAKKKKMLLIISIVIAVVGIAVAVGVVMSMGGSKKEDAAEEHTEIAPVAIYDVPEFNLSLLGDDPSSQHFIKIKMSLELVKMADSETVNKILPRLQDDWGGFLRQMRLADLQGSANLQRLKESLLRRANQSLAPVEVKAVYIRELLVQ
ncbi:MAG: hypothetical protein DI585_03850 [Pseudomonas fluorescens]|nr:MAG: hypothetical protein DI585_03850 [Pseudomonas fluorescens]